MWLINSSIGRKVVMSVTGIALILFLTFHASMNIVALISTSGYNMICEFLGSNWYAVAGTIGLAALVALHFIYAFWLTIQNNKARGNNKYNVTSKPAKVEWASQNMLVLGIIVILGMCLHLFNFWWNMMAADLGISCGNGICDTDGVAQIANTFACPVYTVLYLIWLCALWFHLTHGFWSAFQTLGWNGKVWFKRWRCIGMIYSTIIILMFAVVALSFALCPCYKTAACGECEKCPAQTECQQQCDQPCEKACPCDTCQCDPCECPNE